MLFQHDLNGCFLCWRSISLSFSSPWTLFYDWITLLLDEVHVSSKEASNPICAWLDDNTFWNAALIGLNKCLFLQELKELNQALGLLISETETQKKVLMEIWNKFFHEIRCFRCYSCVIVKLLRGFSMGRWYSVVSCKADGNATHYSVCNFSAWTKRKVSVKGNIFLYI